LLLLRVSHAWSESQAVNTGNLSEALKNFGLTEKEAATYIFLANQGAQRSGAIAKGTKTHRAEIYRILKSLQVKGLVQPTLESPTRFTATPFEKVVDSFIKSKREEADSIEKAKQELLKDWDAANKCILDQQLEKFLVIEGRKRIYSKILEMVNRSKSQSSAIITPQALARISEFGVIDAALSKPSMPRVQFRLITELAKENLDTIKTILNRSTKLDLQFRTPELGLKAYPQMLIIDEAEAIFFTKSQADLPPAEQDTTCLWSDCKSLVDAFQQLFDQLWRNSQDFREETDEQDKTVMQVKPVPTSVEPSEKCRRLMKQAQKEILMMISSDGVIDLARDVEQLEEWKRRGVSVKILAPITTEILEAAKALFDFCEIKHIPTGYLDTTIIDGNQLFQFKNPTSDSKRMPDAFTREPLLDKAFYTSDMEHVEKTKKEFDEIWKNAQGLSTVSLQTITHPKPESDDLALESRITDVVKKIVGVKVENENPKITEKEILNKLISSSRKDGKQEDTVKLCGYSGQAMIHLPSSFGSTEIVFHMFHFEKNSAFGIEDTIIILTLNKTPLGNFFSPTILICDNPEAMKSWQKILRCYPNELSFLLVGKEQIQVRIHGNTLFCGWTVEIPLPPSQLRLQPSCIILEGYGKIKPGSFTVNHPSGFRQIWENNTLDAFVTFVNEKTNYSGCGSDGIIGRDLIGITYSPDKKLTNHII